MRGIYLTSDLFFSSRIMAAARERNWTIDVAPSADKARVASRTDGATVGLLLIDLANSPGDLESLITDVRADHPVVHVLAYGPHVDDALLSAARQAGCDTVLSRGQFNQQATDWIERHLADT